jgi:large subunit ribosomal protein L32
MPVPKRKMSRRRRGNRQSHDGLKMIALGKCGQCSQPVIPHRVCPSCGYYHGRQVMAVDES